MVKSFKFFKGTYSRLNKSVYFNLDKYTFVFLLLFASFTFNSYSQTGDCEGLPSFEVQVDGSVIGCLDSFSTLTATIVPQGNSGFTYEWEYSSNSTNGIDGDWTAVDDDGNPDSDESTYNASEVGWYRVFATLDDKCTAVDAIKIKDEKPKDIYVECQDELWECSSDFSLNFTYVQWLLSFDYSGGGEFPEVTFKYSLNNNDTYDDAIEVDYVDQVPGPTDQCESYFVKIWIDVVDECTDENDDPNRCSGTFIVLPDTSEPVFEDTPADESYQCLSDVPDGSVLTWTDNCDGSGTVDPTDTIESMEDENCKTILRTWTYTDSCGNTATTTQTITINDTTPPELTIPEDYLVECIEDVLECDTSLATATDNCSEVTITCEQSEMPSESGFCGIVVTNTFTATDACGNTTTATQTITINDSTPPTIDTESSDQTVECDGLGNTTELDEWLASNGGAIASDICSEVTWSNDYEGLSDDCGETGSATVTFTATDACDNTASTTATFTIIDSTPPTIGTPASDATVQCDGQGNTTELDEWLASNGGASASDDCSAVSWSNNYTELSDECGATGSASVTFTATDSCGNTVSTSATFTIEDTTAPLITTEASDLTIDCDGSDTGGLLQAWLDDNGGATATDLCSDVTWSNDYDGENADCSAPVLVTFTATDDCGNTASTSASYTINDTTPPTIDMPSSDATVQCDGQGNTTELQDWLDSYGGASATDDCSSVSWSNDYTQLSDECGATGSATVTFTATDACGNTASTSATFTIEDTTAPLITTEASDLTIDCDGSDTSGLLQEWLDDNGGATATDLCSDVTWSNDYDGENADCSAPVLVTFTATDTCGNTASTSASYTINDTTPPTIDTPASDATVQCDGQGNTTELNEWLASYGDASASDDCSAVSWSNDYTELSDECGETGSAIVTFTATDACGNIATTSATFTIQDTTAPLIPTEASDLTIDCDGSDTSGLLQAWLDDNGGATAADLCSDVSWSNDYDGENADCSAPVLITFTATDACGNTASTSASYTINDTTPPTIDTAASNVTVECDEVDNSIALNDWLTTNGGAIASDDCSSVTWTNDFTGISNECGETGTATITFMATDACGNIATTTATFTIIDTTSPIMDLEATDLIVECDGAGNTTEFNDWLNNYGGASASDECSEVTWEDNFSAISENCGPSGSATVTFTATDNCGNTAETIATFTIIDTTPPELTIPEDFSVECLEDVPECNEDLASTSDCGEVSITCVQSEMESEDGLCGIIVTNTFTATDACGNTTTKVQTITINDTIPPELTIPEDMTVECIEEIDDCDVNLASATDNCNEVTITCEQSEMPSEDGFCGVIVQNTFTATDACGNTTTKVQTITINDTTPPTIDTESSDQTVECDGLGNTSELDAWLASNGGALASDLCSEVSWTNDYEGLSDECGETGSATVTFTATDACDNSASTTATFTIVDTTPPELTIPEDIFVECIEDVAECNESLATYFDSCGEVTISCEQSEVPTPGQGCGITFINTFTATDACGNTTTAVQTIFFNDTTPPELAIPPDITVDCIEDVLDCDINQAVALDDCGEVVITCEQSIGDSDDGCGVIILNIYTATDSCGNTTTKIQTINTTEDFEPPTLVNSYEETITEFDDCNIVFEIPELEFSDNCTSSEDLIIEFNETSTPVEPDGDRTITRTWTVTDLCGNNSTYTQTIVYDCGVVLACRLDDLDISKMVTPNGDSHNEYFFVADEVEGDNGSPCSIHVQIFNRWGAKIFESEDYQNTWNGFSHSNSVGSADKFPTGTYYYVIQFKEQGVVGDTRTGYFYLATE